MNKSLRVAQLLCAGRFGGAEAVACALTQALIPHVEHSVLFLILETRAGVEANEHLLRKISTYHLNIRIFRTEQRISPKLLDELRRACHEEGINVVHSHSYKAACLDGALTLAQRLIQRSDRRHSQQTLKSDRHVSVFTLHGMDLAWSPAAIVPSIATWAGAYLVDRLIGCSRPISEHFRRFPVLRDRVTTLVNAVPLETLNASELAYDRSIEKQRFAERYDLDPHARWLAAIGRLIPIKNISLLLRAAALVRDRSSIPIQYLIVGDGVEAPSLKHEAERLQISSHVRFLGHLDDLSSCYRTMDALVLPSISEGSPMVVLEAMCFGVPVIASAVGGVPDIVDDGVTGLLFPSENVETLTEHLLRFANDASLRTQLGSQGRLRILNAFHPNLWAQRHAELYREQWFAR